MNYFAVELRHGENKQVWIACCETEADAADPVQEALGAFPDARVETGALNGEPPFRLKPNTVRQWV